MWKQFFELFRQVLTLTEDTQRNRGEIKELREQVRVLSLTVQKLTGDVEKLATLLAVEMRYAKEREQNAREREQAEREKFLLLIESQFLLFERRLPPAQPGEGDTK